MLIRPGAACLLSALFAAGGCTPSIITVKSGTTTPVTGLSSYSRADCTSWEPPEARVTTAPAHGVATVHLAQSTVRAAGHPCLGKVINQRVVAYTPKAGFRGQDTFEIRYDYITTDGGGRGTQSERLVVNVQ